MRHGRAPGESNRGVGQEDYVIYDVTCEACGQRWQRTKALEGEPAACLFCGNEGRFRLGPAPPDAGRVGHVEVVLEIARQRWR